MSAIAITITVYVAGALAFGGDELEMQGRYGNRRYSLVVAFALLWPIFPIAVICGSFVYLWRWIRGGAQ